MENHDENALLATIRLFPTDDLPRLVYADWLDEHATTVACSSCRGKGKILLGFAGPGTTNPVEGTCRECTGGTAADGRAARAELIRVQCEMDRLERVIKRVGFVSNDSLPGYPGDAARLSELSARCDQLTTLLTKSLQLELAPLVSRVLTRRPVTEPSEYVFEFRRGFVDRLTVPNFRLTGFNRPLGDDVVDVVAQLVKKYPLTRVVVSDRLPVFRRGLFWWNDGAASGRPDTVPKHVFKHLPRRHHKYTCYGSVAKATDALSCAILAAAGAPAAASIAQHFWDETVAPPRPA